MGETHLDHHVVAIAPSLVPVTRRIVSWDADGNPVVQNVPMLTKSQIIDIVAAAVSQPYSSPDDELAVELGLPPSEFHGATLMEVMLVKAAREAAETGDPDMVEKLLDRLLGKPKQTSEVLKTVATYEERLREIGAQRAREAKPAGGGDGGDGEILDADLSL